MPTLRPVLILLGSAFLLSAPARAAVLLDEYALRGSLDDTVGTTPLTAVGGQITALGYVFAANQGLTFTNHDFTPANYSIEVSFKLETVAGDTKVMDFHNLTSNSGLYVHDGTLTFASGGSAPTASIVAGVNVNVVLTRNSATNVVTAFVNGQQSFSFVDTGSLAAMPGFSNKLSLFLDDSPTGQASGGVVNYVRIFNGALTSDEVSALYAGGPPLSIPEPSVAALLLVGGGAVFVTRRIRRKAAGKH